MEITTQSSDARLIEMEAIIVAYAMSRLDRAFLDRFGFSTWKIAFAAAGEALDVPPASMKNLRDEFDPLHNFRKGWHKRPLRPNRQRVLSEFCEVSDEALLEISGRLLEHSKDAIEEIVRPLAFAKERAENVAERLRTGRLAEEFFLANSESICGVPSTSLVDRRNEAAGFDFAVDGRPRLAIEIKGLKQKKGSILFTDFEWRTAGVRRKDYWLVVIGNLSSRPVGRVWYDPTESIFAKSSARRTTTISWHAAVSVAI